MSGQHIVTGDAVVLDLRPARIPTRTMAAAIDLAVAGVLSYLWYYVQELVRGESYAKQDAMAILGYLVTTLGWTIGCETATRGRTLGHLALGLRAVRDDGGMIGFRHALVRGMAFWLVDFNPVSGGLLGLLVAAVHPQGKRLGDVLAGTLVVRTRAPRTTRPLPDPTPEAAAWATALEMSRITDEQVAASRYALQRAHLLRKRHRAGLVANLARQAAQFVSPRPPAEMDPEDFLAALVAEHRRRGLAKQQVSLGVDIPTAWR